MDNPATLLREVVTRALAGEITKSDALLAFDPASAEALLRHHIGVASTDGDGPGTEPIATGLAASPGAAVGRVYLSADRAEAAFDRGEDVILVQRETSPADLGGMEVAEGILTTSGGITSHAAIVARQWGKPAVCGASEITLGDGQFLVGSDIVAEGDTITIDGTAGAVFLGDATVDAPAQDHPDDGDPDPTGSALETLLEWADEVRAGRLGIRANADTPADAATAREFGAEGIGLCRTEHQFLGDRLPLLRRALLADEHESGAAFDELAAAQRDDFVELLEAMDGLPVTVRLLDPPLHEFLPDLAEPEVNPMMGARGVRLGILKPDLYRAQVRALIGAVADRRARGGHPLVEVMVPLVATRAELALVRRWIEEEAAAASMVEAEPISVGSMVESPRAALVAGDVAAVADFVSFGTNDLTQLTFGFSRDDVESSIMALYLEQGLLPANPFQTLDRDGVGHLVASASEAARAANPDIKIGICGEHGGDPESIEFFFSAGLDYVSCSPFRVPVARLAAARAVLNATR